jgi:hypothetical protein
MNIKLIALAATLALTGLCVAYAADGDKKVDDPRIDKLIQQNEQILKNQAEILKRLDKIDQDLLQLRRRVS